MVIIFGGEGLRGFTTIILAAGMGSRMQSSFAKVLHPLCGMPMIEYVIDTVQKAGSTRTVVVVGHQAEHVKSVIRRGVEFAYQAEQKGTGHAVMQAESLLRETEGPVLITYGDTPLYRADTFRRLVDDHVKEGSVASILTGYFDDPTGYGRIIRSAEGNFVRVVEQKDATADEAAVNEINTGTYCFEARHLFRGLQALKPENAQGEYYLPDVLTSLLHEGHKVRAHVVDDPSEALGINDRKQLAEAENILRERIKESWMEKGITLIDPASTWIDARVQIGTDTIIFPSTMLEGDTIVGESSRVGPFSHIRNAHIGDNAVVERAFIDGAKIPSGTKVGPDEQLVAGTSEPRCEWLFKTETTS